MVANTVVNPQKYENTSSIPLRLVNPLPLPIIIREGTSVARVSSLDSDAVVSTVKVDDDSIDDLQLTVPSHTKQVL